jgi:hypothetical protein
MYVLCDIAPGLRDEEISVAVRGTDGRRHFLRVDRDFVDEVDGRHYLPIGIVGRLPGQGVLIELPHEADSGANRLWVREEQLRGVEVRVRSEAG